MPDYLVRWEIDQSSETPRQAAELAWAARSALGSTANVFTVIDQAGQRTTVDLSVPGEIAGAMPRLPPPRDADNGG
jgi:hypothetical protein